MKIQRGAEAVLLKRGNRLVKKRERKSYRIEQLDTSLRKARTKRESSLLIKARRLGISVPRVYDSREFEIEMEYIEGKTLKESLESYEQIGEAIAYLHSAGIMHGDLTTSNMIIHKGRLYMIDFGLAKTTKKVEDFANDLFLLYEALKSSHYQVFKEAWESILKAYKNKYSKANDALKQFKKIQQRRRYK